MPFDAEFGRLIEQVRRGDDLAATEIHGRYVQRLILMASRQFHLWDMMRTDGAPEDVVQSVFRTFFGRMRRGEFQLNGWDALWALLSLITRRKCRARHDYLRADRRDIGRESEQDESLTVDSQPTPAEAAMLAETLSTWLAGLDPPARAILEHGLQGFQTAEIAIRLGRSERSVRRVRERAEANLRTMLEVG